MHRRNRALVVASVAIASLWGPISLRIHAQSRSQAGDDTASRPAPKSGTTAADTECHGNSCTVLLDDEATNKSGTSTAAKPYDWKTSFAQYKVGKVPRTADGKADLQGIWSRTTLVPMERPRSQDKKEIDAATAAKLEDEAQQKQVDLRTEPTDTPPGEKTTDAYNTFWRDGYWFKVPMTSLRTSQVVDPPDGRLPPQTLAARVRQNRAAELDNRPATGPEDRPPSSRCVRRPGAPGPAFSGSGPGGQESTLEIIQGTDAVIVRGESLESQLIYLDGRPRPPENVHLELGAARGHWEGDTLIVEYTNFSDEEGAGKEHLTARYKRLDDNHLLFGFTRDDPGTRTKPYSVEFVMWRLMDQEQLVEYACHEGNVGLEFTLSAARAKEREEAAEAAKEQGK
jgi:hypothetical protein